MKNHLQRTRITTMTQYILINIFRILGLGEKCNNTPAERRAQARNMSSQFLIDQKIITKKHNTYKFYMATHIQNW